MSDPNPTPSPDELRGLLAAMLSERDDIAYYSGPSSARWAPAKHAFYAGVEQALPSLLDRLTLLEAERERLREADLLAQAAFELIEGAASTYQARNGRHMGIEADDGEKCWIIHSDLVAALQGRLDCYRAALPQGEG